MDFYSLFEYGATVLDSLIVICAVSKMVLPEYPIEKKAFIHLIGTSLLSVVVIVCNQVHWFSFATAIFALVFTAIYFCAILRKFTVLVASSTVLTYFIMGTIEYISLIVFGLLIESPVQDTTSFYTLMTPGSTRTVFISVVKATQSILLVALYRFLPKIKQVQSKYLLVIFVASTVFYFTMSYLFSMVLSESLLVTQTGLVFSWLFMALCVIVLLIFFFILGQYRTEQEKNLMLETSNTLMEENYDRLHQQQKAYSKLNHDFVHHIRLIQSFARQENNEEILSYTQSLLSSAYQDVHLCKSGNNAIDAVVNAKINEAKKENIEFSYQINLIKALPIESIDICAILANQIDNAFDACKLIPDISQRKTEVHIWQPTEEVVIFKVSNFTVRNPFEHNEELHTTKTDKRREHGYGLQSIRESAAKYEGTLDNTYQNGMFISTVSVVIPD